MLPLLKKTSPLFFSNYRKEKILFIAFVLFGLNLGFGQFAVTIENANGPEDAGAIALSATLDNDVEGGFTVQISTTDGSATLNDNDYVGIAGRTLTFDGTAGETVNFTVTPIADATEEPDETLVISMENLGNTTLTVDISDTATITITNDDACTAGNVAPVLDGSVDTIFCDIFAQDLDEYTNSLAPAGSDLRWSTNPDITETDDYLETSFTSIAGTYYGFFYDQLNDCTSPSFNVTLTSNTTPSSGVANNVAACTFAGGASTIDLDDQLAGADTGFWTSLDLPQNVIGPDNEVSFLFRPLGEYRFRFTTNGAVAPCNNQATELVITVIDCFELCNAGTTAPVLDTSEPTVFCDEINANLDDYVISNPPPNSQLRWSTDPNVLPPNLNSGVIVTNAASYFGYYYDEDNNCRSPLITISLQLFTSPEVINTTGETRCGPGTLILEASASDSGFLNWYASPTGGSVIGVGSSFETPFISETTSFFVEATANGCSSERTEVVATVNPLPFVGTPTNTIACNVLGNEDPTVIDLDDTLTGEDSGSWSIVTDLSGGTLVIGSGNTVDFENLPTGNYVFEYTTDGAIAPCTDSTVQVIIFVSNCLFDTDNDGLSDSEENDLGTDPNNPDTDGDGLTDGEEVLVVDDLSTPLIPENMTDPLDSCDPFLTPACNPDPIDLALAKTVNEETVLLNREVSFTITLENNTMDRVIDIVVNDLLGAGFDYIAHTASKGLYDPITGDWSIDNIIPEEILTLEITVTVLEIGTLTNTATIISTFPIDTVENNNVASASVEVIPSPCQTPGTLCNIFSPNGDGFNDTLKLVDPNNEFEDARLEVFDRYGNSVFKMDSYDSSWDGTGDNGELPKGTYFYLLDLKDGSEVTKGWIQIIR
ncbi:hypothetical protein HME9304_02166 [Flagellimonas maritima]|uniref:DUF11 domain-containing protein n=1 Tax=Flagellimonas maritima TaxID=1383885 RepID=A0A2Z4LTL5_9FLAO|nr:gliding motility-associated C-terminal domain-containing protein [Allomuricauda aurantiaca]AWX45156.1 hypothetical protein HME9304_02166 [Allomuricauda aurantiaca]